MRDIFRIGVPVASDIVGELIFHAQIGSICAPRVSTISEFANNISKWTKTNVKPQGLMADGEDGVVADQVSPLPRNDISHSD